VEDICHGLNYLHNNVPPILHLDLKPKNILIDGFNEFRAVIADFGLSVMMKQSNSNIQCGGTYPYMAPEFISGQFSSKSDIYSFAIVMWEMLMYAEPYQYVPDRNLLPAVVNGLRPSWDNSPFLIPSVLISIVQRCWSYDPKDRPSANQLCEEIINIHRNFGIQFLDL